MQASRPGWQAGHLSRPSQGCQHCDGCRCCMPCSRRATVALSCQQTRAGEMRGRCHAAPKPCCHAPKPCCRVPHAQPAADWGVLRLTLVNFAAGGSASELSFLAERTEGDAMCLRCGGPGWEGIHGVVDWWGGGGRKDMGWWNGGVYV